MEELDWQDRHAAYLALRATLHALRDRLTVEEVAELGAQLPMLIRGFDLRALGSDRQARMGAPRGRLSGLDRPAVSGSRPR